MDLPLRILNSRKLKEKEKVGLSSISIIIFLQKQRRDGYDKRENFPL